MSSTRAVFVTLLSFSLAPALWAGPGVSDGARMTRTTQTAPCPSPSPTFQDAATERVQHRSYKAEVETLIKRVGTLRKRLEEWGSVTVSAPMVMREVGEFDLGEESTFPNTLQYINLALTSAQGGVSQSTATGFSNSFDLTVTPTFSINPLTGVKQAITPPASGDTGLTPKSIASGPTVSLINQFAAPGSTGGTAGQFAPPGSLLVGPNGNAANQLKTGTAAATGLAAPSSFTLSGAQAAMLGTNAKITEKLMRVMANPPQRLFTNPDQEIHFAIVQVSCNPGWRTRENYIADVYATCEFYRSNPADDQLRDAGCVVGYEGYNPLVFSVLPLIDAQTLELQNSERNLTQLAAAISAAFPTAAANLKGRDLIQFVKQYQRDVQTTTPRTVANSYSSGSTFGFRLMPSLTALKDPARKGSKPANILQATSFPVLVTVVVNKAVAARLKADSVRVSIAHRWLINDNPKIIEFWHAIGLPLWRDCTGNRVDLAIDYGEARQRMNALLDNQNYPEYREATATLQRDLAELRSKTIGEGNPLFCLARLPEVRKNATSPPSDPIVQKVVPNSVTKDGDATLFISGLNLFTASGGSYVAGKAGNDPRDPGIEIRLGQIKGTVLLANGDDQLVANFPGLQNLSETDSTSLVVQTKVGAVGWGKAVKLVAPPGGKSNKTAISEVGVSDVVMDSTGANGSFAITINGAKLDAVTKIGLNGLDGKDLGYKPVLFTHVDGTQIVAVFSAVAGLEAKDAVVDIFAGKDVVGTSKPFKTPRIAAGN